jgi:hypothetical protein
VVPHTADAEVGVTLSAVAERLAPQRSISF